MTKRWNPLTHAMVWVLLFSLYSLEARAQFNSGSDGSDGALSLTTPGTYVFDPDDTATYGRVFDPDRDYVYHFTNITIGAGVTLKLTGRSLRAPVFWLSQGPIQILGVLNLDGEDGLIPSTLARTLSIPGPGGFPGGMAAFGTSLPQAGNGPGGGIVSKQCAGTNFTVPGGGTFTGNSLLVPLVGGSGGAGGGSAGGAGGGAIVLASSNTITVTGSITAKGGKGVSGGGGSGGAIRLVGSTILGSGSLSVARGTGTTQCGTGAPDGSIGGIRLEAFNFNTTLVGTRATPFGTFIPPAPPMLAVVAVGGQPVAASPTVSFQVPDVTFASPTAVPFDIVATNVKPGTVVKLFISSENGVDQTINSTPLQGTLQQSTATATATLPAGYSTAYVKANWTP